jgi:hypothetical protein
LGKEIGLAEKKSFLSRVLPKTKKRNRKRLILFFTCLLISFFFWFINTMSKKYTFVISSSLAYEHIPPDKALKTDPNQKVLLTVEGTGWQFLFSRINVLYSPLKIDMRKLRNNVIYLREHYADLIRQLDPKVRIIHSYPDTIRYSFAEKMMKKVPVNLVADISFEKQFYFRDHIRLSPDSVLISGPEQEIRKIDKWPTRKIILHNLNKDVERQVFLTKSLSGHIELSVSTVDLAIPVEKYTEWDVVKPLKLKGNDHGYNIQLLPHTCHIFYQVGLSRFYRVSPDMFAIHVDFLQAGEDGMLDVQLEKAPPFVRAVRIVPDKIQYIVIK